jgi:hypothetical protein
MDNFVIKLYNKIFAIECKASASPKLTKGNYSAFEDIAPTHTFITIPTGVAWSMHTKIDVVPMEEIKTMLN